MPQGGVRNVELLTPLRAAPASDDGDAASRGAGLLSDLRAQQALGGGPLQSLGLAVRAELAVDGAQVGLHRAG